MQVGTYFSLKYALTKSPFAPNRLRNIRVEGWGRIIQALRQFWLEGKETNLETSHWQNADGSEKRLL